MKILLDECVPRSLGRHLKGHECKTVPEMGWAGIKNGKLLALAQGLFDVFLTVDSNLPSQQPIQTFKIAVVVVVAPTNDIKDIWPLVPLILAQITAAKPRQAILVKAD